MFTFNKKWLEYLKQENKDLNKRNEKLFEEKEELKKIIEYQKGKITRLELSAGDPRILLENILGREIKWVDTSGMSDNDLGAWRQMAQSILTNTVFCSFVGGIDKDGNITNGEIVKNIIEEIARGAKSYEEVRDLRMTINGIELIREYLQDIGYPEKKKNEPDEGILSEVI